MNELALFAGAGGGVLGGKLLGWRCVCAVELDEYARRVLIARQNDGCLDPFPIWDDVRTFDGRPWRGVVDLVSGGFPCQDISAAGKGAGITGSRSGLWSEMARIISEVRPRYVWVENSPMLVQRGLAVVLGDLAALGFDARWGIVGAHHAGAPHKRDRIWILAHAQSGRFQGCNIGNRMHQAASGDWPAESSRGGCGVDAAMAHAEGQRSGTGLCGDESRQVAQFADCGGNVPNTVRLGSQAGISESSQRETWDAGIAIDGDSRRTGAGGWWSAEPDVGRVAHGVAARVDRLRCLGNGQVPEVARTAFQILKGMA